jgi:C4-dicarboxylate-specific signal transduction histidine kinase
MLRATTKSPGSKIEIRIRDHGAGISGEFIVTLPRQTIE